MADEERETPEEEVLRLDEEAPSLEEQYGRLIDRAAESVLDESIEELAAELARPPDPDFAEWLRSFSFMTARWDRTKAGRRKRLQYDRELEEIGERLYEIPPTPEERKALLDEILERVPSFRQEIPGHFRDVDSLSDEDVSRVLRRWAPLGDLTTFIDDGVDVDYWADDVLGDDDWEDLGDEDDEFEEPLRAGTFSGPKGRSDGGASDGEGEGDPEGG